jgi:hypothetical protein
MRAIEFIRETFDKPLPWRKSQGRWGTEYDFDTSNGSRCNVLFAKTGSRCEIVFDVDGEMDLTGKGEAIPIFSTVVDIFKNYMNGPESDDITHLSFSAKSDEPSRVKLYQRFAKMIPQFGFTYTGENQNNQYRNFNFVSNDYEEPNNSPNRSTIQIEGTVNNPVDIPDWLIDLYDRSIKADYSGGRGSSSDAKRSATFASKALVRGLDKVFGQGEGWKHGYDLAMAHKTKYGYDDRDDYLDNN